jgi:hypothetical protein
VIRHAVALPVVHVIDRPLGSTDQSDSSLQSNHPSSDADLDEEESELRLGGSSSTPYGRQLEQAKLNQKLISWDLKKKDMSGMQMQLGSMHISAKHQGVVSSLALFKNSGYGANSSSNSADQLSMCHELLPSEKAKLALSIPSSCRSENEFHDLRSIALRVSGSGGGSECRNVGAASTAAVASTAASWTCSTQLGRFHCIDRLLWDGRQQSCALLIRRS